MSSPPERTYAADIVIDSQDKFNDLKINSDWSYTVNDCLYLKAPVYDNTIIFEDITSDISLAGGRGSAADNNNNTIILLNSKVNANDVIGGYASEGKDANNNKLFCE